MDTDFEDGNWPFGGEGSARFHALVGANAMVSEEKQLIFFIVQLKHYVSSEEGYDTTERLEDENDISWYTLAGDELGTVSGVSERINFLNPGHESLVALWCAFGETTQEGGYTGNESSTRIVTYTRCAIVAWQKVKHREKAMKLMSPATAAAALLSGGKVDVKMVRQLFKAAGSKRLSMEYYRLVCELLAKAGDAKTVVLFFEKYCPNLEDDWIEKVGPPLTRIVRAFDWSEIGKAVLLSTSFDMALYVLDNLDKSTAQEDLLKQAVEVEESNLFTAFRIGLLWKWVVRSEDKSLFDIVAKKLSHADASDVGPSIQYLSQYLSEGEMEKSTVLASTIHKRGKWLKEKIKALDKKFTWEMPKASVDGELSETGKIQAFLRSGEVTMTTKGVRSFKNLQGARNFIANYMRKGQNQCSFEMIATGDEGSGDDESGEEKADEETVDEAVFVTITKTRDWFMKQQKELVQYQTELRFLKEKFGDVFKANAEDTKRARYTE